MSSHANCYVRPEGGRETEGGWMVVGRSSPWARYSEGNSNPETYTNNVFDSKMRGITYTHFRHRFLVLRYWLLIEPSRIYFLHHLLWMNLILLPNSTMDYNDT